MVRPVVKEVAVKVSGVFMGSMRYDRAAAADDIGWFGSESYGSAVVVVDGCGAWVIYSSSSYDGDAVTV